MKSNPKQAMSAFHRFCILSLLAATLLSGLHSQRATAQTVALADPRLEAAVRQQLNKPTGILTVTDMLTLTNLDAHSRGITNLSGLETATNLTVLDLGWQSATIANPWVVSNLVQLTYLALQAAGVRDASWARPLRGLVHLDLYSNQVRDASPLAGLTNLTYLHLGWNGTTNLSLLSGLTQLTLVGFAGNALTDVSFLYSMHGLDTVALDFNQLNAFPALGFWPRLTHLNMDNNPFGPVSAAVAAGPTNLQQLVLRNCGIPDFSFVSNFPTLQSLLLDGNLASDSTPLSNLTNLSDLHLSGNRLTNLTALTRITPLTHLELATNRVADVSPLRSLTNLTYLDLRANRLAQIGPLTNLPALTYLDLRGNTLDLATNSPVMPVIQALQRAGTTVYYLPQNSAPTISAASAWTLAMTTPASLAFGVGDDFTPPAELTVTGSCADPSLVPPSGITLGGSNTSRTLTVTPAPGQTGNSTITLTVTDVQGTSTSAAIQITVLPAIPVSFADSNLEAAVRLELSRPVGTLTSFDLLQLTSLSAEAANIANLAGLEWASNLFYLDLEYNAITDVSPLAGLAGLQGLYLSYNPVADIKPLLALPNVVWLGLGGMSLSNLAFVDFFPQLLSLAVASNQIADLTPLTRLGGLQSLYVGYNPVTNLDRVQSLTSLTLLDVSGMGLRNLAFVPPLTGLKTLRAQHNELTNLAPVAALANLTTLYLNDNNLTDISALTPMSKLRKVDVSLNLLDLTAGGPAMSVVLSLSGRGVTVIYSPQKITLPPLAFPGAALGLPGPAWSTGGDAYWFSQTNVTHDGTAAARSGAIGDGSQSWLETTVTGPGKLTFWWKVSSEANYDFLEVYLNGTLLPGRISGEVNWQQQSITLPAGPQTVRWRYTKDMLCCLSGADAAWLDDVSLVSSVPSLQAPRRDDSTFSVSLTTVTGRTYYLEFKPTLSASNWTTLAGIGGTGDTITLADSAATNAQRFYRVRME